MKIFIDTANLNEIKEAASFGILDGVTTNPSLMAKEGHKDVRKTYEEICKMVSGPVSAEVVSTDYEGILKEGLLYLKKAIAGDKLDPDFTQKAILSFIKAQEKKKMKPEPYFYLSYIALLCHDKDLSLKYLNVVKEIKPDLPGIKNLESRLMN